MCEVIETNCIFGHHRAGFGWEESNSIVKVGVLVGVNVSIHKWDLYSVFGNISPKSLWK